MWSLVGSLIIIGKLTKGYVWSVIVAQASGKDSAPLFIKAESSAVDVWVIGIGTGTGFALRGRNNY